jgi:hypothetical protein
VRTEEEEEKDYGSSAKAKQMKCAGCSDTGSGSGSGCFMPSPSSQAYLTQKAAPGLVRPASAPLGQMTVCAIQQSAQLTVGSLGT